MNEKDFLKKYNISASTFTATGLSFKLLTEIQTDYISQFQKFDDAGASLVRSLLRYPLVHSVKYRIKDSEHLIAKIVRKYEKQPKLDINIENYQDHIRDIIGIRILHLFKADWNIIHENLLDNFKLVGKPEANVRRGDLTDFINYYKKNGCKIKYHTEGYRSVHYLVKTEPTKKPLICEIQVRTIFEEAWSEIDHAVRYPHFKDNKIMNQYLTLFNRLAGSADEMGGFVLSLKEEALLSANNVLEIEKLQDQIQKSSLKEAEKREIEQGLQSIVFPGSEFSMGNLGKVLNSMKQQDSFLKTNFPSPTIAAAIAALKNKP